MSQNPLPSQDTTQILQKIFTGRIVGKPAMGYTPLRATVIKSDNSTVTVTIINYAPTAAFLCTYEPHWHWNGSTNVQAMPPPAGTGCDVYFPPNDPQGIGSAVNFAGWPTA